MSSTTFTGDGMQEILQKASKGEERAYSFTEQNHEAINRSLFQQAQEEAQDRQQESQAFAESALAGRSERQYAEREIERAARKRAKKKHITYARAYAEILDEKRHVYDQMQFAGAGV